MNLSMPRNLCYPPVILAQAESRGAGRRQVPLNKRGSGGMVDAHAVRSMWLRPCGFEIPPPPPECAVGRKSQNVRITSVSNQ